MSREYFIQQQVAELVYGAEEIIGALKIFGIDKDDQSFAGHTLRHLDDGLVALRDASNAVKRVVLEVGGVPQGPFVITSSGREVYLLDPRPEDIVVDDIAHALACLNRWTGHAWGCYSVAQHCLHVSRIAQQIAPPEFREQARVYGLLHDAPEAYLGDVSRPLRSLLPRLNTLEERFAGVILEAFGLPPMPAELTEIIKISDDVALVLEVRELMPEQRLASWLPPLPPWLPPLDALPAPMCPARVPDACVAMRHRLDAIRSQNTVEDRIVPDESQETQSTTPTPQEAASGSCGPPGGSWRDLLTAPDPVAQGAPSTCSVCAREGVTRPAGPSGVCSSCENADG